MYTCEWYTSGSISFLTTESSCALCMMEAAQPHCFEHRPHERFTPYNASFPSRSFYTERQLMWKSMLWTPYVACNILPLSSYTFTASYAIWGRCWMQDYGWNCKWLHHRWCLHIFLIIKSACAWKSGIDVSSDQPESFTLYIFVTRSHQLTGNTEKSLNSKNNEKWKSYHFLIKSTVTLGRRTRHKHLAVQIRLDRKGYS